MFSAPQATLAEIAGAMVGPASRLEYLTLHSQSVEFVLPKTVLGGEAPQLQHLDLNGVSLATLRPLLPSATSLVSLVLKHYPSASSPRFSAQVSGQSVFFHQVASPAWICLRSPNS
jgi:hypothetical protein